MAIPKITGDLFSTIRSWVWERKKTIRPNPLKRSNIQVVTEKVIDNNKLQKTLNAFLKKINKIIDEVNKLIKKVAKHKNEIAAIKKRLKIAEGQLKKKSTRTHKHIATSLEHLEHHQ